MFENSFHSCSDSATMGKIFVNRKRETSIVNREVREYISSQDS
jgi:hypothetical protein